MNKFVPLVALVARGPGLFWVLLDNENKEIIAKGEASKLLGGEPLNLVLE
jgi:hypothetical protein